MTNGNQTASFIGHKWRVRSTHFHEKCSNESPDTPQKAIFLQAKCPLFLLVDMELAKLVAHAWVVRDMNFQENLSKGRRGTADKAKCSLCES
jgi:hypothetical protein